MEKMELTYDVISGRFSFELYNPTTEQLNAVLEFVNTCMDIRVSIRFVAPNVLTLSSSYARELVDAVKEISDSSHKLKHLRQELSKMAEHFAQQDQEYLNS